MDGLDDFEMPEWYWDLSSAAVMFIFNEDCDSWSDEEDNCFWYDGGIEPSPDRVAMDRIIKSINSMPVQTNWFRQGRRELHVYMPDFLTWCVKQEFLPASGVTERLQKYGCPLTQEFYLHERRLKLKKFLVNWDPMKHSITEMRTAKAELFETESQIAAIDAVTNASLTTGLEQGQAAQPATTETDQWAFLPKGDVARQNVIAMLRGAKLAIDTRKDDCLYNGKLSAEAIAEEALDLRAQWPEKKTNVPKKRTLAGWVRKWLTVKQPDPTSKRA